MINYYSELNIDKKLNLKEINEELDKQENLWRRREVTNPEKAAKIIALIFEARKIFQTIESKREYDDQIEKESRDASASNTSARENEAFEKWKASVKYYFETGDFDLAVTAAENAFHHMDTACEDDDFFNLVAQVYMELRNYGVALKYINKSIVINPDSAFHYIIKGKILTGQTLESEHRHEAGTLTDKSRELFAAAIKKADDARDFDMSGKARGVLAASLFYGMFSNVIEAERIAREAIEYGDSWGNAQKVLDTINAENDKRKQQDDWEKSRQRKQHLKELRQGFENNYQEEQFDLAERMIKDALKEYIPDSDQDIWPEYIFYENEASIYAMNSKLSLALEKVDAAIEKCPKSDIGYLIQIYSTRVDILIRMYDESHNITNLKNARNAAKIALDLAQKADEKDSAIEILLLMADIYGRENNEDVHMLMDRIIQLGNTGCTAKELIEEFS